MREDGKQIDISNIFENTDDLPLELQEQIRLIHAKICERQKYHGQLQEIQFSPRE